MTTLFNMDGTTALVTGGSGGLGRHFAEVLAAHGAHVVVAARRMDELEETVELVREKGGKASWALMDVTDRQSVEEAFSSAEASHGPVTVLVNNAGVANRGDFLKADEESWQQVIDINLSGVFRVAQVAAQRMVAAKRQGSIINISSILGLRVTKGVAAYCATKGSVAHMTKALALELAEHGIRVNALAPGYYETDINRAYLHSSLGQKLIARIPMQRTGEYHELNGPLLLLASDAGSYMTGVTLPVDGGHLVNSV